jgi:hypothetical protein
VRLEGGTRQIVRDADTLRHLKIIGIQFAVGLATKYSKAL